MKKITFLIALLPLLLMAQNSKILVMPGYSLTEHISGPSFRVQYAQPFTCHDTASRHWMWNVELASVNGVSDFSDYLHQDDLMMYGDALGIGISYRLNVASRLSFEVGLLAYYTYWFTSKQRANGGATPYAGLYLSAGGDLKLNYNFGNGLVLGAYGSVQAKRHLPYGSPIFSTGLIVGKSF